MDFCLLLLRSLPRRLLQTSDFSVNLIEERKKENLQQRCCEHLPTFLLTCRVTVARLFHIFEMVYFSPPNWLLDVQCVFVIGAWDLEAHCRSTMAHRFALKKEFFNWNSHFPPRRNNLAAYFPPSYIYSIISTPNCLCQRKFYIIIKIHSPALFAT